MTLVALCSAKGSPGVSTSALALTLSWPRGVLLAECDLAGGDALAGFLAGQLPADRGLAGLAVAHARGRLAAGFTGQLVDLDPPHQRRLLLPGVPSPANADVAADIGQDLAAYLSGLAGPADTGGSGEAMDVVADCGRLWARQVMWAVLRAADVVLLVVRADLLSLHHARAALPALQAARGGTAGEGSRPVGLLLVDHGPYGEEIARHLDAPVLGWLPWLPRAAARLSHGAGPGRRAMRLLTAARSLHGPIARAHGTGHTGAAEQRPSVAPAAPEVRHAV